MKHYFLVVFLFVGMVNIYATDIISSLDVTVPQLEDSIPPTRRRAILVEQEFQIRNFQQDSINLSISQSALSLLFLQHWEANQGEAQDSIFQKRADIFQFKITADGQDVGKQIHYSNGKMTVPLSGKSKNHKLQINFRFISNQSQKYFDSPNHPTASFVRMDYFQNEWYFILDSIIWDKIQIHVPHSENIELIANHPLKQKKDTYQVDLAHSTRDNGLAFSVIEKDLCVKKTLNSAHTKLNFYSSKYFDVDTISWKPINIISPSEEQVEKDAQATLKFCDQVRDFFYDQTDKTFHVFKCYTNRANFSYLTDNYIFVSFDSTLFDSRYYKTERWQHEFVHCFTADLVMEDSTLYLFSEGIATFCGWCMDYMNGDSVVYSNGKTPVVGLDSLMQRYEYYFSVMTEVKNTPVLNINYNCKWAAEVIYYKSPYVFYLFAKRIGMDKFIDIIRRYYAHLREQSLLVTLQSFEDFFKTNGVSDEDWEYFISLLS